MDAADCAAAGDRENRHASRRCWNQVKDASGDAYRQPFPHFVSLLCTLHIHQRFHEPDLSVLMWWSSLVRRRRAAGRPPVKWPTRWFSRTTMVTAWEFPRNPLTDPSLDDSRLSNEIRSGFRIFTNTAVEAGRFTPGRMTCNNCHLNGGQREKSLPLVGITGMFPEYNRRSGRLFSLGDRIVDCFLRSQNATEQRMRRNFLRGPAACAVGLSDLAVEGIRGRQSPEARQNTIPAAKLS